ncbi:MAG TPA: hypothetical protein DE315_01235 [Candidatus Omnitrophica bacterium]|nr:hypothetical protein [Candidatus Omnitrophota bacterium]HCI44145.1 hypothetical protein [Candidatus Omnitrophota bacterium]
MRSLTSRDPSTRPRGSLRVSPRENNPSRREPAGGRLKFLKFWFPVFLYSGIIFYASSLPDLKPPLEIKNIDKAVHVLEYLPFGFLLAGAFSQQWPAVRLWQAVTICSLLYGISDEYHQSFVPGREAGIPDVIADTTGGFLGVWIYLFRQKRIKNKLRVS